MKTSKGGNGVGIYYLRDIDQSELAEGLFGYTTRFNGLAVVLNNLLNQESDEGAANIIQAFHNEGEKSINMWKMAESNFCKAPIRNKGDEPLWIRIEYHKPSITILFHDE